MKSLEDLGREEERGIKKTVGGLCFLVFGIVVILFSFQSLTHAQSSCAPVIGDPTIDGICCVDPLTLGYTSPPSEEYPLGETSHNAYVGCVADEVVELRLLGNLSDSEAKDTVERAAASKVNKTPAAPPL